ncbi:3-deoxy-7-phosphoheptulonate synthase [Enterovibrio norvegicus]|uniref:3-deoxy-7-phosphoheptulonate synthase n=1 Tax=Enterovibrio norvegicus TaxID=188144 RepID=UPI000C84CDB6|nr:3-deoxy-7-phosphoheptulonate synthase [Enterovibrio norvegicus]MCC4797401.1 3-deoxy-7-phosphoheptulonate synthase [Enterovibrio norvegicus]PMH66413.1 3-deoxy-7-phosphoheptulonate synthase [Enterovibrio norvegicus]PMI27116.1 3-deoxy-7-phosphoheptulonate synthase [Enterovibrio norvegicus]PMI34117.1 3-deoxy-7-phosphoheptulonate synthase [Enterovibrio norvegicus]PMN56008.1 3-deoxy-7-phosphoheptulonate synthase [Enterovibrio norvegicus]
MIIVLKPHATERQAKVILGKIEQAGLKPLFMPGVERIVLGALGDERVLQKLNIESDPLVEEVKPILSKYKMVSREVQAHNTVVRIGNMSIGGGKFAVIAGPCSVESEQQLLSVAEVVKSHGAAALRGGAYKPRTSPYDFQGMGVEGLKLLKQASDATGMPTVSEVMEVSQVDSLCEYIDCLQIGARNMQNYGLLKAVGETGKPVLLKRGLSATIEELLLAAEYIYDAGNPNIILCERGIRTYETATRNTLDLNAVAYIKQRSHLPVVVDPSHGTGVRELVIPLSRAAAAVGADGIIVESHLNPAEALSDGHQALTGDMFAQLMQELKPFVEAAGRTL